MMCDCDKSYIVLSNVFCDFVTGGVLWGRCELFNIMHVKSDCVKQIKS